MNKQWLQYKKTIALALGIGATFAMPPYYQIWILFICFGGLISMLANANSSKQAFALGYWFGFGFFAVGLSWITHALAMDLKSFWWLMPIALSASGAFFGLFVALSAWGSYFFRGIGAKTVAFAALWGGPMMATFLSEKS